MANRRKRHPRRLVKRRWKISRVITWATLGALGVTIVVLGLFAFTGGDDGPRRRVRQEPVVTDEQQVTVDVDDGFFEPNDLTVRVGTEVTWKFKGDAAHDVTDDGGVFASGTMTSGDEYMVTFKEPGTYYYNCTLHHAMHGTLTVQP
jgi:plastocyanin